MKSCVRSCARSDAKTEGAIFLNTDRPSQSCPILSNRFRWTQPGVRWNLVVQENRKNNRVHRKCSHNMKPEVSTTVGGAGKSSDGLHRIHWKQIDCDGISGSLVVNMSRYKHVMS